MVSNAATYRATVTEVQMRESIMAAVALQGGRVFYIRDSRNAPELVDFPDLVVILPGKNMVAFVELKSQKRKVTDGQAAVIATLEQCHDVVTLIVRPEPKLGECSYGWLMDWIAT